jgi:hypothetical protein
MTPGPSAASAAGARRRCHRLGSSSLCRSCDRLINGYEGTTLEGWKEACFGCGLLDREETPAKIRSFFGKYKIELIQRNWVACDTTTAWLIGPNLNPGPGSVGPM